MPAIASAIAGIFLPKLSCKYAVNKNAVASIKKVSFTILPIFFSKKSSDAQISKNKIPASNNKTDKLNLRLSNNLKATGNKTAPAKKCSICLNLSFFIPNISGSDKVIRKFLNEWLFYRTPMLKFFLWLHLSYFSIHINKNVQAVCFLV